MFSNLISVQPLYSGLMSQSAKQGLDQFDNNSARQQKVEQPAASNKLYQQSSYQRQDSFAFSLKTQDGDEVSINISRAAHLQNQQLQTADRSSQAFELSREGAFDMSVNGNLDEAELDAIDGLMQQIQSLSDEFFAGNIGQAMNQAMQLDYNASEIQGFSLDLHQREVVQIATYSEVQAMPDQSQGKDKPLEPAQQDSLNNHAQQLLNSLDELKQSSSMLSGLIEMVLPEQTQIQQWFNDWLNEKLVA